MFITSFLLQVFCMTVKVRTSEILQGAKQLSDDGKDVPLNVMSQLSQDEIYSLIEYKIHNSISYAINMLNMYREKLSTDMIHRLVRLIMHKIDSIVGKGTYEEFDKLLYDKIFHHTYSNILELFRRKVYPFDLLVAMMRLLGIVELSIGRDKIKMYGISYRDMCIDIVKMLGPNKDKNIRYNIENLIAYKSLHQIALFCGHKQDIYIDELNEGTKYFHGIFLNKKYEYQDIRDNSEKMIHELLKATSNDRKEIVIKKLYSANT